MKTKVLLTGATGFLGAHLAIDLLLLETPVIAIKRKNSSLQEFEQIWNEYAAHSNEDNLLSRIHY